VRLQASQLVQIFLFFSSHIEFVNKKKGNYTDIHRNQITFIPIPDKSCLRNCNS